MFGLVSIVFVGLANGVKAACFIAFRYRGVYHTEGRKLVFKRKLGCYLPVNPACIKVCCLPSALRVYGIEHGWGVLSHPFYLGFVVVYFVSLPIQPDTSRCPQALYDVERADMIDCEPRCGQFVLAHFVQFGRYTRCIYGVMFVLMETKCTHNPLVSAFVGRAEGEFLAHLVLPMRHFNGEDVAWRIVLVYFYATIIVLKCGLTVHTPALGIVSPTHAQRANQPAVSAFAIVGNGL